MSFQPLIVILKGSSTSGNFGHSGRPGKWGGSAPGGGHGAIGVSSNMSQDDRRKLIDKVRQGDKPTKRQDASDQSLSKDTDFYNKEWVLENKLHDEETKLVGEWLGIDQDAAKALIGKSYSYKDGETGYSASIESLSRDSKNSVKVTGSIYDKDGNPVGTFERTINKDKSVHHDLFEMNDEAQGSGFGSRFYKNAEDTYKQAGVKEVHMFANLDVGGYAWGRMGFDFSDSSGQNKTIDRFRKEYQSRYKKPAGLAVIPQTAYEMAAWTGPDGYRLGKDAMLGSEWNGRKSLSDNDTGYRIGQEYYASKGKKK